MLFSSTRRLQVSSPTTNPDRIWSGALTPTSFKVVADTRQSMGDVRLVVSPNSDMSSPVYTSSYQSATVSQGAFYSYQTYSFQATGLTANTQYYYRVESRSAPNHMAGLPVKTAPATASAFSFVIVSCDHINPNIASTGTAGLGKTRSIIHRSAALESVLFCLHTDDMLYTDIATTDMGTQRDQKMRNWLQSPDVAVLSRAMPIAYIPGDHDMAQNDSTLDSANAETIFRNARTHYREMVPYYPFAQTALGESNIDHVLLTQTFDIGTVRFIMPDLMSQSSSSRSTIFGTGIGSSGDYWDQTTWLQTALNQAVTDGITLVFLVLSRAWNGYNQTCFNDVFTADRTRVCDMIESCSVPVALIVGDSHCAGFDDGGNCAAFSTDGFSRFPQIQASGMYNTPVSDVGVFSWNGSNTYVGKPTGAAAPADGQYTVVTVAANNKDWSAIVKGIPINDSTYAPTTLKSVTSTDVTPAVSFNNAAPSGTANTPTTINLDKAWFGACSVNWDCGNGQSGTATFLPNKKRTSFTITAPVGNYSIILSGASGCTISGTNPVALTVT